MLDGRLSLGRDASGGPHVGLRARRTTRSSACRRRCSPALRRVRPARAGSVVARHDDQRGRRGASGHQPYAARDASAHRRTRSRRSYAGSSRGHCGTDGIWINARRQSPDGRRGASRPTARGRARRRDAPAPTSRWAWLAPLGTAPIRLTPDNVVVSMSVRWLGGMIVRGRFTDVRGVIHLPTDDDDTAGA